MATALQEDKVPEYTYDKANHERDGGVMESKGGKKGIDDGYSATGENKSFSGEGKANVIESRLNSGASRTMGKKGIGSQ